MKHTLIGRLSAGVAQSLLVLGLVAVVPSVAVAQDDGAAEASPPQGGAEAAGDGAEAGSEEGADDATEDGEGDAAAQADEPPAGGDGVDQIEGTEIPEVPEGDGQMAQFRKSYERYAREMKDYQKTIDAIVEAEYSQRVAKVRSQYERKINALETVERERRVGAIAAFEEFLRRYPNTPRYTPDAMFRLAELYFEKAKDDYLVADEEYLVEMARYEAGKRADPPSAPQHDYSQTIAIFEQLIAEWPDYRFLDGAYYLLAYTQLQEGNPEVARNLFAELIDKRPDSQFIPEAWIRIGEYHFDFSDEPSELLKAKQAYEKAMEFTDSKFYDKALYKLAWTYYRLDNFDSAIDHFKQLVRYSDEQKRKTGKSGSVLRAEAIQYIAVSLSEEDWDLDGAVDADFGLPRVKRYLAGDEPYEREVLVRLSEYLFENTRYAVAADVINYSLERYRRHPDNPKLHEQLILALMRDGKTDAAFEERRTMLALYGPDSNWMAFQKRVGNEEAVRYADNLVKDNLIQSATWFHEEAQKLKDEAIVRQDEEMLALARTKYATAADAYAQYLQRYPNDKDVYQWNFYYAETLYYSGQYLPAYEQYKVVRELDMADNKYQEQAGYNAVKSLEFRIDELVEQGQLSAKLMNGREEARKTAQGQDDVQRGAAQAAGESQDGKITFEPEKIPALADRWITAMDRYVVLGLKNEDDPQLDAKFAFSAGKIYYDFLHFDTARERFNWIIDEYPESELAYLAGSLILETYRREKDYPALAAAAERLSNVIQGEQAEAIKAEVREFKLGAMFKSAEQLFQEGEYEKAAEEYMRLVNNDPDHKNASKALNNAAVAYEKIGKYESAMKLYERVYLEYPDDPLAAYALYRVGVNSERFFDFDKAVRTYEAFYDKYAGQNPPELEAMGFVVEEKRQNALKSAGVLTENLQRYPEAAKLYEQYVRQYPNTEDADAVQWQAVLTWKKAQRPDKMMDAIATYRREFGGNPENATRVLRGMMMTADYYAEQGNDRRARQWYEDVIAEFDRRGLQPGTNAAYYAAKAKFMLVEEEFAEWKELKITGSLKRQEKLLERKVTWMQEVAKRFDEVVQYQNLEWTMAAIFRKGALFQYFANALYDVPVPFEEGTEEYDIYRTQLEDMTIQFEDKAIATYEKVIDKARAEKIVNEWTKKTLEELNKFMPDKYPLYKEERQARALSARTGAALIGPADYDALLEDPEVQMEGDEGAGQSDVASEQEGDDS